MILRWADRSQWRGKQALTSDGGPDPLSRGPLARPLRAIRLGGPADVRASSFHDEAPPLEGGALGESELNAALDLIARAAAEIPELRKRSETVESVARLILKQAQQKLAAVSLETEELRQRALQGEARAEEAERRLRDAERRAQEADRVATHAARCLARFHEELVQKLAPAYDLIDHYEEEGNPPSSYEAWAAPAPHRRAPSDER